MCDVYIRKVTTWHLVTWATELQITNNITYAIIKSRNKLNSYLLMIKDKCRKCVIYELQMYTSKSSVRDFYNTSMWLGVIAGSGVGSSQCQSQGKKARSSAGKFTITIMADRESLPRRLSLNCCQISVSSERLSFTHFCRVKTGFCAYTNLPSENRPLVTKKLDPD